MMGSWCAAASGFAKHLKFAHESSIPIRRYCNENIGGMNINAGSIGIDRRAGVISGQGVANVVVVTLGPMLEGGLC
jgi:hypothetical protein